MRRRIGTIVLLAMGLAMAGCGSGYGGPGSGNINGSWTASLTKSEGIDRLPIFSHIYSGHRRPTGRDQLHFHLARPLAPPPIKRRKRGTFNFMGNLNGKVTGSFGLTVTPMLPGATNHVLTLRTVNGNTISGIWTLTGGAGCRGSGTFIIQPKTAGG